MKRICAQCKRNMGERCGRCGSLNVADLGTRTGGVWKCLDCGSTWEPGSQPNTHGLCDECLLEPQPKPLLAR